ncbi:MAG: hypothetical protein ACT4PJ_00365 [Gemmatimonadaceae bacterium]
MSDRPELSDFPGGDLVAEGLRDLGARQETAAALLVSMATARLRRLGLDVPPAFPDPEQRLYRMLANEDPQSAHGRYNALVRRLVSFERAAECAI